MKFLRKLVALGLACAVTATLAVGSAYAQTSKIQQEEILSSSAALIHVYDLLFSGHGTALDSNGNDVTQKIKSTFSDAYRMQGYQAILDGCRQLGVASIRCSKAEVPANTTRAIMTIPYEESVLYLAL